MALYFDEALNTFSVPAPGDFTVRQGSGLLVRTVSGGRGRGPVRGADDGLAGVVGNAVRCDVHARHEPHPGLGGQRGGRVPADGERRGSRQAGDPVGEGGRREGRADLRQAARPGQRAGEERVPRMRSYSTDAADQEIDGTPDDPNDPNDMDTTPDTLGLDGDRDRGVGEDGGAAPAGPGAPLRPGVRADLQEAFRVAAPWPRRRPPLRRGRVRERGGGERPGVPVRQQQLDGGRAGWEHHPARQAAVRDRRDARGVVVHGQGVGRGGDGDGGGLLGGRCAGAQALAQPRPGAGRDGDGELQPPGGRAGAVGHRRQPAGRHRGPGGVEPGGRGAHRRVQRRAGRARGPGQRVQLRAGVQRELRGQARLQGAAGRRRCRRPTPG